MAVAGCLLVLSQVQAVFSFVMGNAIFLRNRKGGANDVDVLYTLSEINDDGTIENLDDSGHG